MTRRRTWIKVHHDWWTSPNHIGLGADVLGVGVFLLMLADGDPEWRETGRARLVDGQGLALSCQRLAKLGQVRGRKMASVCQKLVSVGTLELDPATGVYSFPNYRDFQENSAAARMRKHRAKSVTVTPAVTVEEKKRERERERENEPPHTSRDLESERRHVLGLFRDAVAYDPECRPTLPNGKQLGPLMVGERTILGLIEQGATKAELHSVAQKLAKRIASGELPPTLWNGGAFGWPYPMLRDDLPVRGHSKPGHAPQPDAIVDEEEAKAWSRANRNRAPPGWMWQSNGRGYDLVRKEVEHG
jgi:hypothetical protein